MSTPVPVLTAAPADKHTVAFGTVKLIVLPKGVNPENAITRIIPSIAAKKILFMFVSLETE